MMKFSIKEICGKCNKPCEESEMPTEKYPLAGFWKHSASDHFGYEVTSNENGDYFVMFKGPGGSDNQEDNERYKTTIKNDKRFKIHDLNNMEIKNIFKFRKVQRYKNRCSEELEIFTPNQNSIKVTD